MASIDEIGSRMAKLMITGAAGKIGTALRHRFREHELRLTDINELPEPLTPNETFAPAPLTDEATLARLAEGADCVVHLGGLLVDHGFADTAATNIMGTYHALEATRTAGVSRFFYASSNHAVGYTPVADIDPQAPVDRIAIRPDGYYGVTKIAAEGLCALFADNYGMTVLSARILTFAPEPRSLRELATWISPDDTARLVLATLTIQTPGHHVCWGVSRNTRGWANLAAGEALGFYPKDDSEPWAERIIAASTEADRERLIAVGGRVPPAGKMTSQKKAGSAR
jgi:uronate dehydrogenase